MKVLALGLVGIGLVLLLVQGVAYGLFARQVAGLVRRLETGPVVRVDAASVPEVVRAFAQRGGAGRGGRFVVLQQEAVMELRAGAGWQPMQARQWIGLGEAGFLWRARQGVGPITTLVVVDSYVAGRGLLEARLLGSIRVARAEGAEADRGEVMRYLAELPWVPDAILGNPDLRWRVVRPAEVAVTMGDAIDAPQVRFLFDAGGDIVEMRAQGRPATVADGGTVLKEWRGRFSDYGEIGGRRIPLSGEVGYVEDGIYAPYWRGRVTAYAVRD